LTSTITGTFESVLATDWSITWAELAQILTDLTRLALTTEFCPRIRLKSLEPGETNADRSETELGGFGTREKISAEFFERDRENGFVVVAMDSGSD
jgi:hypothetical protein